MGEVNLAARMCLPPNDRVRAVVERNFGGPVDEGVMRIAILTTRLPRIDRTIQELVTEAKAGDRSLAFVVGSIRKMGEYHAEEVAKIR